MAKRYDYSRLEKHKLKSSNIDWAAYDKDSNTMYVAFLPKANNTDGSVYAYDDVPEDIFDGLLNAGSHGRYFWVKIRNKNYKYQRIR